jgi:STAS-like domain of unknown function (DUF4325)
MTLSVAKICGDSRVFRDDGLKLRNEIERIWSREGTIEIDFENVRIASASFLDEGIAVLARMLPLPEIQRKLKLISITEPDRQLLNHLISSRARERLGHVAEPVAQQPELPRVRSRSSVAPVRRRGPHR